jgi:hypothetical protein
VAVYHLYVKYTIHSHNLFEWKSAIDYKQLEPNRKTIAVV